MKRTLLVALAALIAAASRSARAEDTSLRSRLGVDAAEGLLSSPLPSERLRGLERLGESRSPRAITRLERALEPGGSAATPEERLTAVRALAGQSSDQNARRALVRVLGGHATPTSLVTPHPMDVLTERTAALALAETGAPDAIAALGKALAVPGRASEAAHLALVAHPPKDPAVLLRSATLSTLALAETLSELADPRTANRLRELVLTGSEAVRAAALPALARLGDKEAVPLATRWTQDGSSTLRTAGARILVEARDKSAGRAVERLVLDPETARAGVELARQLGDPALVPALVRRLDVAIGDERTRALRALGACAGKAAVAALVAALGKPDRAVAAADTLARMKDGEAAQALETALRVPATRRLAVRAAAIRRAELGEKLGGAKETAELLARSKDLSDRAAAWALRAAWDPGIVSAPRPPKDDLLFAVAPTILLEDGEGAAALAGRLGTERDVATRTALAFSLAGDDAKTSVPTRELVSLVDARNAASPLAAWALAARDETRSRNAVRALLWSRSPTLRAHAALGLGWSEQPDAAGLLDAAYRFETEDVVREAVVRALGFRNRGEQRTLALAGRLDPSPRVRALAAGKEPERTEDETTSLWLVVPPSSIGGKAAPGVAVVVTREGLSLPVVAAPDSEAVVLGLPAGAHTLRVAPEGEHDDDAARGERGDEEGDGKGSNKP